MVTIQEFFHTEVFHWSFLDSACNVTYSRRLTVPQGAWGCQGPLGPSALSPAPAGSPQAGGPAPRPGSSWSPPGRAPQALGSPCQAPSPASPAGLPGPQRELLGSRLCPAPLSLAPGTWILSAFGTDSSFFTVLNVVKRCFCIIKKYWRLTWKLKLYFSSS